jgi:hypothetical protein
MTVDRTPILRLSRALNPSHHRGPSKRGIAALLLNVDTDLSYINNNGVDMRTIGKGSIASVIRVLLAFGQFGALIGLIIAACVTVALPFIGNPKLTVSIPVSFTLDTLSPVVVGRSGLDFTILNDKEQAKRDTRRQIASLNGSLRVPTSDRRFIAAQSSVLIAVLAFFWYVMGKLRRVFQTLTAGTPFVPENAARIRAVAIALIAGEFVQSAIVFAENVYARTHVAVAGLQFDRWPHLNFGAIGHALIILVIAEVFRLGTRLDEEQSLTI